ncbi:MAG: carboxypeptidase-like regulatory domain-containing protein [Maribacter sp.]
MKKILLKTSFFLCFFFISNTALSQQEDYIIGKLLDIKTQEPIAFATIRIKDRALGIISNADGSFKIPLKYKEYGDIIEISSMGYQKKEVPLKEFSLTNFNTTTLTPSVFELTEAIVRGKKTKRPKRLSAAQIVNKAIKAIPENYPLRTFSSIGYYRDYQVIKDKYVNLNEAILEVIDSGFDQHDFPTTKVRIYNYQNNNDFGKDLQGSFKYDYKKYQKYIDKAYLFNYGGNEFTILRIHDAIRNFKYNSFDFINVMERDFVSNHFFKKEEEIKLDDEVLYVISFAKILIKYRIIGKIYISKKDFAIHKLEYALYDKTRINESKEYDANGTDNVTLFKVITEYSRSFNKMYPNYISFFNTFQVNKPPKFILEETFIDYECQCFQLTFNNGVDQFYMKNKEYYDFRFKGKKIKIEKIQSRKDSQDVVYVYPVLSRKEFLNMSSDLNVASRKRLEITGMLTVEITGLRDVVGNIINETEYETYKQFREFFVQKTQPNGSILKDTLFMKKNFPIFKEQPIVHPGNLDDYWMNTPLQTKIN